MLDTRVLECDFCVVGGGMAGLVAAISAAREGSKVVLMHERPVLGGNASSEIRMWVCGAKGLNNRETGILEEIMLESLYRNPTKSYALWDSILYDFVKREENITLLLNTTCLDAEVENGEFEDGRSVRIKSVKGYQMTTQRFVKVMAKNYADCSGDSILAPLTGAEFMLGRESRYDFAEDTPLEAADKMTMGMSCLVYGRETNQKIDFIAPEFAKKLTDKDFENRMPDIYDETENFWYLELGGNRDSIGDTEDIRDELVSLALGTWDYVKNSGNFKAENFDVDFLGFLPGKRESRRMVGEYVVTQKDISGGRVFEDEIAFGGWPLDDHFPGGFYHRGVPNTDFATPAPYSLPYRALYSKNVENLFFAGRNISMTHLAMSSIRVMATCALLGEAIGKAASISARYGVTPHGVYTDHLDELQAMLLSEDSFLPSKKRKVGEACLGAKIIGATEIIRNGEDRPHRLYGTEGAEFASSINLGEKLEYRFTEADVKSIHIVFDSDLNRVTLPGGWCEQGHSTRANHLLSSPIMCMPKTLCRDFVLIGSRDGKDEVLLNITDNRKRSYHIECGKIFDSITLIPTASWGDGESVSVISFDFE